MHRGSERQRKKIAQENRRYQAYCTYDIEDVFINPLGFHKAFLIPPVLLLRAPTAVRLNPNRLITHYTKSSELR